MYLKQGYNTRMISKQQTPIKSGFHAKTNADEITKGLDLNEKIAIVTGGYSVLVLKLRER